MAKRSRDGCPTWWHEVKDEIQRKSNNNGDDNGNGLIHDCIKFCSDSRQLMVDQVVEEGAVLLKIPSQCLVSKQRAFRLIPRLQLLEERLLLLVSTMKTKTAPEEESLLYSSLYDVLIALAMAIMAKRDDGNFSALPYLHTLPDRTSFDSLPRRWEDTKIDKLLKGSPLVDRIRAAKDGIAHDYQTIERIWNNEIITNSDDDDGGGSGDTAKTTTTTTFPSFDEYSDMLAAVSSRAFMVKNDDDDNDGNPSLKGDTTTTTTTNVAMIPVLDLCDHNRGEGSSKKNVTYTFQKDGSVEVKSTMKLQKDEVLRITYGALGNGQLLFNYGFAIPQNLEPDGSANDILELKLKNDNAKSTSSSSSITTTIHLRTGPKSYTYGKFVQALEYFMMMNESVEDQSNKNQLENEEEEDEDDMEAFLNGCEDEEVNIYGENDDEEGADDMDNGKDDSIQEELNGLNLLKQELQRRLDQYGTTGTELKDRLSTQKGSSEFYASLLVHSEQRTLFFFIQAIEKLEARLKNDAQAHLRSKIDLPLNQEDGERIANQTDQLVEAYMKIRHGDMS